MKYVGFMKWNLYNKDNPNTWPQIDCPMVIHTGWATENEPNPFKLAKWDNQNGWFKIDGCAVVMTECCYAYIGYVPNGYKTRNVTKCAGNTDCEWCDNGYCLLRESCKQQKEVDEYRIEEKAIWKEFE
jgi:hypothetical protein